MSNLKVVNFTEIVYQVKQSQVSGETLAIWGGRCTEDILLTFLTQWDLTQMPYRIWEYVSNIVFEKNTLPENAILLKRGRVFGPGGDLELRRDEQGFAWRFVGPADAQPPGNYHAENYWQAHPDTIFFQEETSALLWGVRQEGDDRRKEDRVGAARLDYPDANGWSRVQIHYETFSRAGRIEFVWYTNLSEWKEDDNG